MNGVLTFFRDSSFGRFLIPTGIFIIVFSIFAFISVDKSKDYIKVDAVVSKVTLYEEAYYDGDNYNEATYDVFVKYSIDGNEYDSEYGIFSNYKVGDKVTIAYNPVNPNEIVQPNTIVLPIFLLVVGVSTLVGGIVSVLMRHKEMKLEN